MNVYDQALALLATHECAVAHSSINKTKLTRGQSLATSPHLLALQFLIEKLNAFLRRQTEPLRERALIVADETNEHEAFAIELVDGMQRSGEGVIAGTKVDRIVDNAHFVRSKTSRGVQLADLVAYALNRARRCGANPTKLADQAVLHMLDDHVMPLVRTYRATWPG